MYLEHYGSCIMLMLFSRFPGGTSSKESTCQCRRCRRLGFSPWAGRSSGVESGYLITSILAWKITWMEEPDSLQSMGSQRVGATLTTEQRLCKSVDCSPPSPSVHGISQARIEWLPFPFPGDLPRPGIKPTSLGSPALAGGFFTTSARLHLGPSEDIAGFQRGSYSIWEAPITYLEVTEGRLLKKFFSQSIF